MLLRIDYEGNFSYFFAFLRFFAEAKQEERVELVSAYPNYEEYLDSQINSEDEYYLEVRTFLFAWKNVL